MTQTSTSLDQHRNILAIVSLAFGAFVLVGGLALVLVGALLVALPAGELLSAQLLFGLLLLAVLALAGLYLASGIGLLNRRPWARTTTLVAGALSILSFPIGTAYGVYAIWVLTRPDIGTVLDQAAQ